MKKTIGSLLLQIIPVMIGVYLGFVVSNWGENREREKQKQILSQTIQEELKSNQSKIEAVLEYHIMLRDSARSNTQASLKGRPDYFKGTRLANLTSSAYETGMQTGIINEMPLDQLQELNQVYTVQEFYQEFSNILMSGLMTMDFTENNENFRKINNFLAVSMTDIVIQERQLLEHYSRFLNED
ncbi:MAG: hypothetical protein GYB31_05390 [Bacteroidetes bacterium]|nr:hypothetical protein [Bacteroidota bacterium]